MAELTLKTRLLNKMSEAHVDGLLKGEINFYPVGDFLVMEVGGTTLPFAAKASDVAAWAKAAEKPEYQATEIKNLDTFIAGEIQDTNTKYEFVINDNGELVITSKELDGTTKTAATLDILTPAELNTILANYVTETKLVEALSDYVSNTTFATFQETNTAAIAAVQESVNEVQRAFRGADAELSGRLNNVEGKMSLINSIQSTLTSTIGTAQEAKVKANSALESIATINTTIEELQAADTTIEANAKAYADSLAGNYDASGAAAAAESAAKAYADGLASNYDAAGSASAAEAAAKAYADGIKADLLGDDLADTFNTLKDVQDWVDTHGVEATNLSTALAAETKAREEADTALSSRIKAYEDVAATYATKSEVEAVSAVADAAQTADEVASAIDTKIAALDLANTYDAKGAAADALTAAKAYADSLEHENTTYTAGTGLKLDGTVFSIDTDLVFILDANA
jgi:hypothetical protein